jgi:hypothetical protein
VVIVGALVAIALGFGAYRAAEHRGRSGELWLVLGTGFAFAGYYAGYLAAQSLSSSNAMFTQSGTVVALAAVLAGPLAGLAAGGLLIYWLLRAPVVASLSAPLRMFGGRDGGDMVELVVRVEEYGLSILRDGQEQRIEKTRIEKAEVDGAYLVLQIMDEPQRLRLRPTGDEYRDREDCAALVERVKQSLLDRR